MTTRRIIFEGVHKSCGYLALLAAACAIIGGLRLANAVRGLWLLILLWWLLLLVPPIGFRDRAGWSIPIKSFGASTNNIQVTKPGPSSSTAPIGLSHLDCKSTRYGFNTCWE